jgi:hypothetical protein
VYGVTDHQVNILSRNLRSTSGDVNICRNVGGLNTSNIYVNYASKDNTTANVCNVNINHIDLLGGTISGVDIVLDIQSTQSYAPLKFVNYTGAGGSETTAASSNYVQDIRIAGSCDANASLVDVVATYAGRRRLTYIQGYYFLLNATVYAAFQLNQQNTSGTPTWVGSTTNPAIGNGTLTYAIYQTNGMAFLTMKMTAGSTTTFGTGNWTFSNFGVNATYTVLGTWLAKIGSTFYSGTSRIHAGTSELKGYGYNNVNEFNPTFPGSWASGDELTITIAYPIS